MSKIVFIVFLFISSSVNSQWFQANGSASILNDNIEEAREQAIKAAVKDALLFSGGAISSLQQVNRGALVENKLILNSTGEIKALQIISETQQDQKLNITLKVDIVAQKQQCLGSQFPKSVTLSRFTMKVQEQTVDGQIYNLHKKTGETLFKQLSLNQNLLNMRSYVNKPLKLGEKYNNRHLVDTLNSLSIQTDSQYVIFGEINDVSVKFESKNSLSYWFKKPHRNFYMTIYLYDAFQGNLIFSKQYRQQAKWEYGKEEKADLDSKRFWEYQYGRAILSSLDQVSTDIFQRVQCLIPSARVIDVETNSVQINLGKRNGLKQGTIINLSYSSNYKDQFGIERESATVAQQTMKVVDVYENSATLATLDNYPLSNIQINDIARIQLIQ